LIEPTNGFDSEISELEEKLKVAKLARAERQKAINELRTPMEKKLSEELAALKAEKQTLLEAAVKDPETEKLKAELAAVKASRHEQSLQHAAKLREAKELLKSKNKAANEALQKAKQETRAKKKQNQPRPTKAKGVTLTPEMAEQFAAFMSSIKSTPDSKASSSHPGTQEQNS
jgi:chromosome segregation ATPase